MLAIGATLAAVAASVGDVLLLTAADRTPDSLVVGHYLGVLGIPLYALGYWAVARLLGPAHKTAGRVVLGTGIFSSAIGATVHGVTAVMIRMTASSPEAGPDTLPQVQSAAAFLLPLWVLLGVASVVASGFYARAIHRGETALPRWMAFANPLALLLLLALLGSLAGPAQRVVVFAAPNLAHVLFFGLIAWTGRAKPIG